MKKLIAPNKITPIRTNSLKQQGKKSNSLIATGGAKHTTINLEFRKGLIETVNIQAKGFKESVSQMQKEAELAIITALKSATTAIT